MRGAFVYIRDLIAILLVLTAIAGIVSAYLVLGVAAYVLCALWSLSLNEPRNAILKFFHRINKPLSRGPGRDTGVSVPGVPPRTQPVAKTAPRKGERS